MRAYWGECIGGLGEIDSALGYLWDGLAEFGRMEDEKRKLDVLNTLGQAYFINSRTEEAIEYLTSKRRTTGAINEVLPLSSPFPPTEATIADDLCLLET